MTSSLQKYLCLFLVITAISCESGEYLAEVKSHTDTEALGNVDEANTESYIISDSSEKSDSIVRDEALPSADSNSSLELSNMTGLQNETVGEGTADTNSTSANVSVEAKNKLKVECSLKVLAENEIPTVQLASSKMLLKALTPSLANTTTGDCVVVLFYSSQCIFSARMGPHFNALPRVFPDIAFFAVDVTEHSNLYIRYGLVFVPNVMLFHNAKPIARFNESTLNLENFVKFVNKFTGLQTNDTLNVTSVDMTGPVPTVLVKKVDYLLVLAWIFTLCCLFFGFAKSTVCRHIVEHVKNTWQEAEAQHEHRD